MSSICCGYSCSTRLSMAVLFKIRFNFNVFPSVLMQMQGVRMKNQVRYKKKRKSRQNGTVRWFHVFLNREQNQSSIHLQPPTHTREQRHKLRKPEVLLQYPAMPPISAELCAFTAQGPVWLVQGTEPLLNHYFNVEKREGAMIVCLPSHMFISYIIIFLLITLGKALAKQVLNKYFRQSINQIF